MFVKHAVVLHLFQVKIIPPLYMGVSNNNDPYGYRERDRDRDRSTSGRCTSDVVVVVVVASSISSTRKLFDTIYAAATVQCAKISSSTSIFN